ncbi:hypothetical protein QZH41_018769 [Actinostola sp. cb2023]|nr:hypothetical protein QZH41_018769 [Actinostola sp. cb2023]
MLVKDVLESLSLKWLQSITNKDKIEQNSKQILYLTVTDQNEKLVMYGVVHVCAVDGYSGMIVSHALMPVKNNLLIYDHIYRLGKSCRMDLSGSGRLTLGGVNLIQGFYGQAIHHNKHDTKAMAKAVRTILKHYSSSEGNRMHEDCPPGSSSWCSYQRDLDAGTDLHREIHNPLPPTVVEVIQPLFERWGDEAFLVGCEKCYTQNNNESLHHVIWGMAPKDAYNFPYEIDVAITLGMLQLNHGFTHTYKELLTRLELDMPSQMRASWEKIDQAAYRSSDKIMTKRRKKRSKKLIKQDAFVRKEGVMYKSQVVHEGKSKMKQTKNKK